MTGCWGIALIHEWSLAAGDSTFVSINHKNLTMNELMKALKNKSFATWSCLTSANFLEYSAYFTINLSVEEFCALWAITYSMKYFL